MGSLSKTVFLTTAMLGFLFASHGAFADWSVAVSNDRSRVNINSKALDDRTMVYGGCNTRLGPGLSGSIENYNGTALERIEDLSRKISLIVKQPGGSGNFRLWSIITGQ